MGISGRTSAAVTYGTGDRQGTADAGDADGLYGDVNGSGACTAPVPGKVYLRRPAGAAAAHRGSGDSSGTPGDATAAVSGQEAPGQEVVTSAPSPGRDVTGVLSSPGPEAREAVTREIARLLQCWLEAYDGRRPVSVLRRGPYSPAVIDELRNRIRLDIDHRQGVASQLLRVSLPPSHRRRVSFTASAAVDGRVRAVVGHLARHRSKWRVEGVTLV